MKQNERNNSAAYLPNRSKIQPKKFPTVSFDYCSGKIFWAAFQLQIKLFSKPFFIRWTEVNIKIKKFSREPADAGHER